MTNSNEAQELRRLVDKIERLEDQKKEISEEISGIYKDMGNDGFDVEAIKEIIRCRKKDPKKLLEKEAMVEYYTSLLADVVRVRTKN